MRVLYDGVAFQNTYQRGIQRVFREIIGRLPSDIEAVLALGGPAHGELPALGKVVRTGVPLAKAMPRRLRRALGPRISRIGRSQRIAGGGNPSAALHKTFLVDCGKP